MARGEGAAGAAAEIRFDHVTKRYAGRAQPAVTDLSLDVPAGQICVLIGPSGCGKTTALKLVNRLISLTTGDITIDGRSVNDLDETELRRGIGYVIQQVGLFPHMSVEQNVATVPRLLGWEKQRIRARVRELVEDVPADHAVRRYAEEKMELLERLGHASSKAEEGGRESKARVGWDEVPSSAPAYDPLPPRG